MQQLAPLTSHMGSSSPAKRQRVSPNSEKGKKETTKKATKASSSKKRRSKSGNSSSSGSANTSGSSLCSPSSKASEDSDNNLRIKLDGSFNNTTTYSIRSPYGGNKARSEQVKVEREEEVSDEEDVDVEEEEEDIEMGESSEDEEDGQVIKPNDQSFIKQC